MTRKEFAILAETLGTAYKRDNFLSTTRDQEVWYQMLNDMPYEAMSVAVQKWITTEKWSPSIAELRGLVAEIMNEPIPGVEEEWEKVLRIARDYSPYDTERTEERIATLDEISQKCIKLTDVRTIAYSENVGVERAHFMKAYERLACEKKTQNQTSESIRNAIDRMQPKPVAIETEQKTYLPEFPKAPERTMTGFDRELAERFL